MAIASMTGFARTTGQIAEGSFSWELKSVNARAFDARLRLPPGFDALEAPVRAALAKRVKRGNVSVQLSFVRTVPSATLAVNEAVLDQLLALHARYAGRVSLEKPRIEALLAVRGVVEQVEAVVESSEQTARREAAILASFADAVAGLCRVRAEEGGRLGDVLSALLDDIAALHAEASSSAGAQPQALYSRLKAQLDALRDGVPALPEERLAQEVALLATKADIREELDRLAAHIGAARALLSEGGAVGRQFDFLCQEFNREANTLCSKAAEMALTQIGLKLKATIERLREQVQNIE